MTLDEAMKESANERGAMAIDKVKPRTCACESEGVESECLSSNITQMTDTYSECFELLKPIFIGHASKKRLNREILLTYKLLVG